MDSFPAGFFEHPLSEFLIELEQPYARAERLL
jgi:hypothetical protein